MNLSQVSRKESKAEKTFFKVMHKEKNALVSMFLFEKKRTVLLVQSK